MNPTQDWPHKHPRLAGTAVGLCGALVLLGARWFGLDSAKVLFVGLVLLFFGGWAVLTGRTFHPRDKTPAWWTLGCVVLVLTALAIALQY